MSRILGSLHAVDGTGVVRIEDRYDTDEVIDATLTTDRGRTVLVVEVSGLPLGKLPYYGAGWQHNVEVLAAYLSGREPEGEERFEEILPSYLELSAKLG